MMKTMPLVIPQSTIAAPVGAARVVENQDAAGRVLESADTPNQAGDPEGEGDPEDMPVAIHGVPGQISLVREQPERQVDIRQELFQDGRIGPEPVERIQSFEVTGEIGKKFLGQGYRF